MREASNMLEQMMCYIIKLVAKVVLCFQTARKTNSKGDRQPICSTRLITVFENKIFENSSMQLTNIIPTKTLCYVV